MSRKAYNRSSIQHANARPVGDRYFTSATQRNRILGDGLDDASRRKSILQRLPEPQPLVSRGGLPNLRVPHLSGRLQFGGHFIERPQPVEHLHTRIALPTVMVIPTEQRAVYAISARFGVESQNAVPKPVKELFLLLIVLDGRRMVVGALLYLRTIREVYLSTRQMTITGRLSIFVAHSYVRLELCHTHGERLVHSRIVGEGPIFHRLYNVDDLASSSGVVSHIASLPLRRSAKGSVFDGKACFALLRGQSVVRIFF